MELRADVPRDLRQRRLLTEPWAVGAVGAHRVVAVGDDQEVRGERQLLGRDSVVPAAVEPLVMELDRARLGGRELEAAEQASREPGRPPHRAPLGRVQLAGFAQHRGVDRDLAEVVQSGGPAQAVDVGVGETERAGELVHVLSDPNRVTVRGRVALVDDVRERLQGVKRLLPRVPHSPVSAVDGQRHRDHGEDVPGMAECQDREHGAEARLGCRGRELGVERLAGADELQHPA